MAFRIHRKDNFRLPVTIQTPADGKFEEETCTLTCKRLDAEQLDKLRKKDDAEILREVVVGWDGPTDDDGKPVPFNPANFAAFLLIPSAVRASALAYVTAIGGIRQGN